jgi:hypothetical protein
MSDAADGKGCLFAASLVAGFGIGVVLHNNDYSFPLSIGFGLLGALLYPVVGAVAVSFCGALRSIAFPDSKEKWSGDTKAYIGAYWPLSILYWLAITPFFAVISRVFRD